MTPAKGFIGVIADDVTGGASIGAEVARTGHLVDVVRTGQPIRPARSIVLETGSRYLAPSLAAQRVHDAAGLLTDACAAVLMKKIDSTLKGNVATELAAFSAACPGRLLIAPSCPEVGLTLRDGRQFRPGGPGPSVLDLLSPSMAEPLVSLDLGTVRRGSGEVAKWLRQNPDGPVLADSETEADLATVVAGAADAGIVSFGGTYGLGAPLADTFLGSGTAGLFVPPVVDKLLVIAGSASAATAAQLSYLVAAGAEEIILDIGRILTGEANGEGERAAARIHSSSASVLIVHTAAARTGEDVKRHCARLGWNERDLANFLAVPFSLAVQAAPGHALYFIGGETTGAVFDVLAIASLAVRGECTAAVPFAVCTTTPQWPLIMTKPGAFGSESALAGAAHTILGRRSRLHNLPQEASQPGIR
ncbi:four-carbon acid sugar kinase family protein [Pseudarthrobacter sp. GA104]|uniref:four-carbon acid sugar kinase family protein n=1 Tax=Pseudarthrobacter sp. GA104 TaxID=2676311 RepID=UPI0012FB579D|nr:four-carbon acid sugar kinase family protein [Pseudarthrobacter sp. GA104]MUU69708.1 hypothetical protein [Pseudarthrobacter sp. GA104]